MGHTPALLLAALPALTTALLPNLPPDDAVDENNLPQGASLPLSLPEAVQLLRRLGHHQEGDGEPEARFIGVTDGGLYRGDLVVYLPITILLPTFAFRSRYSTAGMENEWWWWSGLLSLIGLGGSDSEGWSSTGRGRIDGPRDIRGPVDQVLLLNEVRFDPGLEDYQVEDYGALLSRLDAYFHYLGVNDDDCRMRAICHLAADPSTFTPLSHLVLSPLKKSESVSRPKTYHPAVFRFFKYYWAAERGAKAAQKETQKEGKEWEGWEGLADSLAEDTCRRAYPKCPAQVQDIVNMSVLRFWQQVANHVSIKLSDE